MKKLIVTADDYGVFPSINNGIIEAVQAGKVNSVAVLTNYENSLQNANNLLEAAGDQNIDIGVHLTITSGKPVTQGQAASMCDGAYFRSYNEFRPGIDTAALRNELNEQIRVLADKGIKVKHLTCHHNSLLLFKEHFNVYLQVAADNRLPMRSPNILPEEKQNNYIRVLRLMLLDDMSVNDSRKVKRFAREICSYFSASTLHVKAPAQLNSEHYGPVPLIDIWPVGVEKWVRKKQDALDSLFTTFLSSERETMELMLHLAKGELNSICNDAGIDYPGINRKYFDSRMMELESIKRYDLGKWPGVTKKGWEDVCPPMNI
jgi:predicted glycoside hydrolase/deacetylase ChbG (UPF0249 family)